MKYAVLMSQLTIASFLFGLYIGSKVFGGHDDNDDWIHYA